MTPEEISEAASGYAGIADQQAVTLYLLDQIRINGGGAAMTMAEIQEAAKCYACIPDPVAAQLYLLNANLA
jgi:hypothetical protein